MTNPDYTTKICSKCGQEKPATVEYFNKHPQCKGGLRSSCKECEKVKNKRWYLKNREAQIAKAQKWYEENTEHKATYDRQYRDDNCEHLREIKREYSRRNREKLNQQARLRPKKKKTQRDLEVVSHWRKNNQHRIREYRRRYNQNPDNYRKALDNNRQRRVHKLQNEGSHTYEEIAIVYDLQGGLCFWCSKSLYDDYHEDHMIPLSRGGSDWIFNIVCSCERCNLSKKDRLPYIEWQPPNPLGFQNGKV